MDATAPSLHWDIFCHVVDNYGDIGGAWRIACGLAERGQAVRLFADDTSALAWMAPGGHAGVQVREIAGLGRPGALAGAGYEAPHVVVSAFGCALPDDVLAALRHAGVDRAVTWIQHEYLSAEPYVERSHGLASPVHGGAPAGVHRWFFFPGFTAGTGGLPREAELMARRARFDRSAWFAAHGIAWEGEPVVGLFCYEPVPLVGLLLQVGAAGGRVLVAHGRSKAAIETAFQRMPGGQSIRARLRTDFLPPLLQADFDEFLWATDLNFVRGEDSLVRAIWAGHGFLWQAYPQDDAAHHAKLEAFLDWMQAPASLREATLAWNASHPAGLPPLFVPEQLQAWRQAVEAARARLLAQDDLATRLLRFVAENR